LTVKAVLPEWNLASENSQPRSTQHGEGNSQCTAFSTSCWNGCWL